MVDLLGRQVGVSRVLVMGRALVRVGDPFPLVVSDSGAVVALHVRGRVVSAVGDVFLVVNAATKGQNSAIVDHQLPRYSSCELEKFVYCSAKLFLRVTCY